MREGTVTTAGVTALGGHRPFRGDEFEIAAAAGLPAEVRDEFAALETGTRIAFDLADPLSVEGEPSDLPGGAWSVNTYQDSNGLTIRVAAAPSSDPRVRRANTPDTYEWFASTLANLQPQQSLLIVTTPIYVPAQHAAALRMLALPYGVDIETVGVDSDDAPSLKQVFTSIHYLQEIRSTIRALKDLWEVL